MLCAMKTDVDRHRPGIQKEWIWQVQDIENGGGLFETTDICHQ